MSDDMVKAVFYWGMNAKSHLIDKLVQPEVSVVWEPALVDIQQRNVYQLMELANVKPSDWRNYLIEKFEFDVLKPTEAALTNVGVPENRLRSAMAMAEEQTQNWLLQDDIDDLWSFDTELPANLTPEQVYEVLAESQARGTPVICFQAEEEELLKALAEDNMITLTSDDGIYVGLSDPINGYGWSPEKLNGPVSFRPSQHGLVVLGNHPLFRDVVEDAYSANVSFVAGEPLRLSSRSEELSRLKPPVVRDERPLDEMIAERSSGMAFGG